MNELFARILQTRLSSSPALSGWLSVCAGLVRTIETDSLTGGKQRVTLPVPVSIDSRTPAEYKLLLPDPQQSGIVYFQDGGYRTKPVAGKNQVQARLVLVCWYNGNKVQGLTNEKLIPVLLNALTQRGRSIPTSEPGVSAVQFTGYSQNNSDPFARYTAYKPLFAFKDPPYGWFSLDISLTAYVDLTCIAL